MLVVGIEVVEVVQDVDVFETDVVVDVVQVVEVFGTEVVVDVDVAEVVVVVVLLP